MRKKILGSVLAVAVLALSSLSALAVGSKTAAVTAVGPNGTSYAVTQYEGEKLAELQTAAPDVAQLVQDSNGDAIDTETMISRVLDMVEAASPEELETFRQELEGKTMLTQFVDLEVSGNVELNADGMYEATLSVPTLTEATTNVRILHYSTTRSLWEIVVPSDVNYTDKQITAAFEDLSPIAVLADVDETADVAEGTSPKTGVASDWGLYMAGAVVLFGAAGVVYSKKRA